MSPTQSLPKKCIKYDTAVLEKEKKQVSFLKAGTRISVWCSCDQEFYAGTLETNLLELELGSNANNHKPHRIQYDNGDSEWTNLKYRKFKRVEPKVGRLNLGSRVSVYNEEEKRYLCARVTKIKPGRARPHRVKYNKSGKKKEFDIEPLMPATNPSVQVNALNLKKRNRKFLDPQAILDRSESCKKNKKNNPKLEEVERQKISCNEICSICKSIATQTRAASCYHIFCRECIKTHCETANKRECPSCKAAINSSLISVKRQPEHTSFKEVEALDRNTADVARSFSSASAASLEIHGLKPFRIIKACQSKQRVNKEYHGFYWRLKGSKERILRACERSTEGVAIEQVDLETGDTIQVFSSMRKADENTAANRSAIRRVLAREGKANAGGFFWRFVGETHEPWPDPEPTNLNPVEQLNFETGELLNSYASMADAKRAMGMKPNRHCITEVCNSEGKSRATANGYFWRWKGSLAQPNHMYGIRKTIQIRKIKNGPVIKEFLNSNEAHEYFGSQIDARTIRKYCLEEKCYKGYHLKYKLLRRRKSAEMEMVGKRIRIQQVESSFEWLEGKITDFNSATGEHEFLFDCGTIQCHRLNNITYEWKNDQGQKSVEQLDLKTGKVLATFESIVDAATSTSTGQANNITGVCYGRIPTSNGYFWRFKGSDALPPKSKSKREVKQLCLTSGRVIAKFESITEASKTLGISKSGISCCCQKSSQQISSGGFGWRFSTEKL